MAVEGAAALSAADEEAEALIAAVYLAGTNTRRVKRALFGLFQGAVGKDVVSRAWRKVGVDWDVWVARSLADDDIIRLILDGTVIRTRLDKKATNTSVVRTRATNNFAVAVDTDGRHDIIGLCVGPRPAALHTGAGLKIRYPLWLTPLSRGELAW